MPLETINSSSLLGTFQQLERSNQELRQTLKSLSTGKKDLQGANRIISEQLKSQIRGLDQALSNSQDALSLTQTAESALGEVNQLLGNLNELSLQAANAAVLDEDAASLIQGQIDTTLNSIDDIASNTLFGTQNILDGSRSPTQSEVNSDELDVEIDQVNFSGPSKRIQIEVEQAATQATTSFDLSNTGQLDSEQTLKVSGQEGTATFEFAEGATGSEIAAEINSQSQQTGVIATFNEDNNQVQVSSTEFGEDAFVRVEDVDESQDLFSFSGSSEFFDPNQNALGKISSETTTVDTALENATFGTTTLNPVGQAPSDEQQAVRDAADQVQSLALSKAQEATKNALLEGKTTQSDIDTAISTALNNDTELASAFQDLQDANTALIAAEPGNPGIGAGATLDNVITSVQTGTTGITDTDLQSSFTFQTSTINGQGSDAQVRVNGTEAQSTDNLSFSFNEGGVQGRFTLDENSNQDGFSSSFAVTSKGAFFQLGSQSQPSNQRGLNLPDASTTSLGRDIIDNPDFDPERDSGENNRRFIDVSLADLRSGGRFDLRNNPNVAQRIIGNAISSVSSARGRLGSFANGVNSNINALEASQRGLLQTQSQLADADLALTVSDKTRLQNLLSAGIRSTATANNFRSAALGLLG